MVINLANAREQYSELGYPHRNILQMQCDKCRLITMVDESIRYDYCPHCGADMREVQSNG
jgi:Zn finger protein HypA/HybF involved in hydrogenase expression